MSQDTNTDSSESLTGFIQNASEQPVFLDWSWMTEFETSEDFAPFTLTSCKLHADIAEFLADQ